MKSARQLAVVIVATIIHAASFARAPTPVPLVDAQARTPVLFTDAQLRAILALGPWPAPAWTDPSNRVSGTADAVQLGALLFADPRLSRDGTRSCASCHRPERAFTDGRPRARGIGDVDRNTTSLQNVGAQRWFGWDGANDNLWAQSLRPLLDSREMGGDLKHVADVVRNDPALSARYAAVFGHAPAADDEAVAIDMTKALAAFQETLVTGRTPFDDFRDALARGDADAADRYPAAARRGLATFIGTGRCTMCHGGPRFSNGEFGDIGIVYFVAPGIVDAGRHDGIRRLKASRYNLLGPYNDDPARTTASSTRFVALEHRNYGEFKVPSLRSVARTAPYMHNGSVATLRDVVRHYSNLDENRLHADGERILTPLGLTESDMDDLVAFLDSLSEYVPAASQLP